MTTGMMKNRLCLLILVLFSVSVQCFAAVTDKATEGKADLKLLLESFSQKKYSKIDFLESKSSSLLVNDIELKGEMLFQHPDYLLKIVRQPHQERFELKNGVVTYQRGEGEERMLAVGDYPVLNAFVIGYTAVLDGDFERLQEHYRIEYDYRDYAWRLSLYPRLDEMREHVTKLEFLGSADVIRSILVYEASGDISTTNFLH